MRVGFAPAARQDTRDIGDYIARHSRAPARTFVAELKAHSVKAARNPEGYPVIAERPLVLRRAVHGAYSIYFSIRPNEVRVERIINAAMDASPGRFEP